MVDFVGCCVWRASDPYRHTIPNTHQWRIANLMWGHCWKRFYNHWDLPADCNDGELFTYAEILFDRILEGAGRDDLYAYLGGVQTDKLEMPPSSAYRSIVDRSLE